MKITIMLLFVLILSVTINAANFVVTNLNDNGAGSLRQAIIDANAASGDDVINFQTGLSGTIILTSGELLINSNITLVGAGASILSVSGNNSSRVFNIAPNASASISNLTVRNGALIIPENAPQGSNAFGGGIYNQGTLLLANSVITNNFAGCVTSPAFCGTFTGAGGGIYNAGAITLTGTNVTNNQTKSGTAGQFFTGYAYGGGIYNTGIANLINSSVSGNTTFATLSNGSGIYNTNILNLTGGAVSNNSSQSGTGAPATSLGGGIYNSGNLTISYNVIENNSVNGGRVSCAGGGIYNNNFLTITNSTISNNRTTDSGNEALPSGGGIYTTVGTTDINDSTISRNSVLRGLNSINTPAGGGIYLHTGTLTVTNSTISENVSSVGGGIFAGGLFAVAITKIKNSTVAFNITNSAPQTVPQGGGIYGKAELVNTIVAGNSSSAGIDFNGTAISYGNNLIGNTSRSNGWVASDILNVDARLAPLSGNGGANQTIALLPDSPAVNAGNNAGAPLTDQRGLPRISGGIIDIGAFESAAFQSANGELKGRVVTANGRIASKAAVTLTSSNGEVITVFTNAFGYFTFSNVPAGNYTLRIRHRLSSFAPQTVFINGNSNEAQLIKSAAI